MSVCKGWAAQRDPLTSSGARIPSFSSCLHPSLCLSLHFQQSSSTKEKMGHSVEIVHSYDLSVSLVFINKARLTLYLFPGSQSVVVWWLQWGSSFRQRVNRSVLTCIGAQGKDIKTSTTVTWTSLCFNSKNQHVSNKSAVSLQPVGAHILHTVLSVIPLQFVIQYFTDAVAKVLKDLRLFGRLKWQGVLVQGVDSLENIQIHTASS